MVSPQKASPGISQSFGGLDGRTHSDNLRQNTEFSLAFLFKTIIAAADMFNIYKQYLNLKLTCDNSTS